MEVLCTQGNSCNHHYHHHQQRLKLLVRWTNQRNLEWHNSNNITTYSCRNKFWRKINCSSYLVILNLCPLVSSNNNSQHKASFKLRISRIHQLKSPNSSKLCSHRFYNNSYSRSNLFLLCWIRATKKREKLNKIITMKRKKNAVMILMRKKMRMKMTIMYKGIKVIQSKTLTSKITHNSLTNLQVIINLRNLKTKQRTSRRTTLRHSCGISSTKSV